MLDRVLSYDYYYLQTAARLSSAQDGQKNGRRKHTIKMFMRAVCVAGNGNRF